MKPIEKPGWNDPPNFTYNEGVEYSKPSKRSFLNKRIAFPINSQCSKEQAPFVDKTAAPCNKLNLPPPPTKNDIGKFEVKESNYSFKNKDEVNKIIDVPNSQNENKECTFVKQLISENDNINEVLGNLYSVMDIKSIICENQNKSELIKRKLQIMEDLWRANKLPPIVKNKIFELSIELKNENLEAANRIQVALMVDHPKLCSEFISIFRQLINAE